MSKYNKKPYESPIVEIVPMSPLCDNGTLPILNGSKDPMLQDPSASDARSGLFFNSESEDQELPHFRSLWEY